MPENGTFLAINLIFCIVAVGIVDTLPLIDILYINNDNYSHEFVKSMVCLMGTT